jgi:hypothetical protein
MPIINGIFTKDFPLLGRPLLPTDLLVVAVPGDEVTYITPYSEIVDFLVIEFTGTTDVNGEITATTGTARLIAVYEGDNLVQPGYNKSTKLLSFLNPSTLITAYFI